MVRSRDKQMAQGNLRLALEILHYIQEPIIDVWLIDKSHLHLVQIAEGILFNMLATDPQMHGVWGKPTLRIGCCP